MYNYVHTTGDVPYRNSPVKKLLDPYVDYYLFSLYNAFTSQKFNRDNLILFSKTFKTFYNELDAQKLICDSGGYSVITGDVPPSEIPILLDCYNYFLKEHNDKFDYIMSLDIPIFLKYPQYNTYKNIRRYNLASIAQSHRILNSNPELYDKFIYVWHFKLQKQFDIWRETFDQILRAEKKVKHFAIGGLVGLRGATNIKFSPFIGPIYRNLKLVEELDLNEESILHILGVYGKHDRFIMKFMDILFNEYYLKNKNSSVNITFDTINYSLTGLYKIRQPPLFDLLGISINDDITTIEKMLIPVIPDEDTRAKVLFEVNNIKAGSVIADTKLLSQTYVIYSQLIDNQMKQFIEQEDLVNLFLKNPNFSKLKFTFTQLFQKAEKQFPLAFGNMTRQMMANMFWLSNFHVAYDSGADLNRIDKGIEMFIKHINFPADLD